MYLLTSIAWRSKASSLSPGLSCTLPPSQPVLPGLLKRSRSLWQPYFASSGPCGGGFQSSRQRSTAVGRAGNGSLGRNNPGRRREMHGQRLPAYQTSYRSGKQASYAWHSRLGIAFGFGLLFFVFPQEEETPVSLGAEANSSESQLQRQKRKGW